MTNFRITKNMKINNILNWQLAGLIPHELISSHEDKEILADYYDESVEFMEKYKTPTGLNGLVFPVILRYFLEVSKKINVEDVVIKCGIIYNSYKDKKLSLDEEAELTHNWFMKEFGVKES